MDGSSIVSRARSALHSAAAKAERVLTDIKSDLSTPDYPELVEQPPKVSVDHLGSQSEEERELKASNDSKQFRWRPPYVGTKQEWQEKIKNIGRGKKGNEDAEKVESPKMLFSVYDVDMYLCNEEAETGSKDPETSPPESSTVCIEDVIPPASVLRQLAIAFESAKSYGSVRDLLNSSRNSSPVRERASLSLSAMKSLMRLDKDEKFRSEHHDDQILSFFQSILDAEGLTPSRKIGCFMEVWPSSMTLPRDIHGAPPESLLAKLAEIMGSFKTLQKMAFFWFKVVDQLRKLWLEDQYVPGLPEDEVPDLNCCLLYQQLQVINCCVSRKKRRHVATELLGSLERDVGCRPDGSNFKKDVSPGSALYARTSTGEVILRLGAVQPADGLTMLETGEPVYAPLTQETPLLTSDLIQEHEEFVLRTGSVGAGCSQLLSDMQAFKAANPGCILEDFVRWHSPPDWTEAEPSNSADDTTREGSSRGRLSSRMQKEGNLWLELWETAKPVPAVRQTPLFDEDLAVEGILTDFEIISPSSLFGQLFLSLLGVGLVIAEATLSTDDNMSRLFYECKDYAVATCLGDSWSERIEDLCQVYESVEAMLVRPEVYMKMIKQREESGEPKGRFKGLSLMFNRKTRKPASNEQRSSEEKPARQSLSGFFDSKSSLFSKRPPKPESVSPATCKSCSLDKDEWMVI